MSDVMWKLRDDHKKLARLMDLIAREVRVFDAGETPDYELVANILDYTQNYPDLYHHPVEDHVLAKLRLRDPEAAANVGDLVQEHEKLGALTRRFAAALHNVVQDETLPRDWFVDIAGDYLTFQRRHMQMEEVVFFPAALRALTEDDWRVIQNTITMPDDPLFGDGEDQERYDRLHREILKWGKPQDVTDFAPS
ncbi:MAG: hemerythrin [Rhodospirillales bacterium CG15_BIG_FIL_POST_REV_8_21_14_020_66_15]|nr:MAG: hemerythrin [Rhodospirillales bacterium CG15_BIG_FIL_POST_REV_8_21_14_020_66_15]